MTNLAASTSAQSERRSDIRVRTEQLLISPSGFAVATATPSQRAAARILDGLPLRELRDHPDVLALVGGRAALEQLPSERGMAPTEVVFLASIRSGKTILACAAAIRATQSVDVSRLGPGEVPRVSLVSLKLDTSAVAFSILLGTICASRVLKPLLIDSTADTLQLRHPSGRAVEIACVAGAKAGGGLIARWSAGAIFDEAPRMSAAADGVVNLGDARTAILGRLLPGAQALYVGSPWSPSGDVYSMVERGWARPSEHMVVLRGQGPMLNPQWWTPDRCAKLEAADPVAYRTDVLGEFADPESGLLNPVAIYRATRDRPLELAPERGAEYHAAVDPSEGTSGGNGWALAIVQRMVEARAPTHWFEQRTSEAPEQQGARFRVMLVREWRGLSPAACWREIAAICLAFGIRRARTDQYAASANVDLARMHGLQLEVDKASAASKLSDYTDLATLMHGDRIELSPDPVLRRDLLNIKRRVTQGASTIVLPRTGDGRHCDLASALCAAIKSAAYQVVQSRYVHVRGL